MSDVVAPQKHPKPVNADILEKFIENQTKELELRSQSVIFEQQKDKNGSFEFQVGKSLHKESPPSLRRGWGGSFQ
jgi:hypothetical protein